MTNTEIVLIANIQQTIINMNVEQVHLKASLSVQWNSVSLLNSIKMIEKTIELEHKVHQVLGPPGPAGPQGLQGERGFNGTQGVQGIQGIQGLQGLPGLEVINVSKLYENTGTIARSDLTSSNSSQAVCDQDQILKQVILQ